MFKFVLFDSINFFYIEKNRHEKKMILFVRTPQHCRTKEGVKETKTGGRSHSPGDSKDFVAREKKMVKGKGKTGHKGHSPGKEKQGKLWVCV